MIAAGLDRAVDRVRAAAPKRIVDLDATPRGWFMLTGWEFLKQKHWDATLGLWVGAPWSAPTKPQAGARVEVRF